MKAEQILDPNKRVELVDKMNFMGLEKFLIILEEGSFSAAKNRLYVSQQSLSEQIKKLEESLGTRLFSRTNPLTLTPAGEKFAEYARDMLSIRDNMLLAIAEESQTPRQVIKIGIPTIESPFFLDELLWEFMNQHKECNIEISKRHMVDIEHNMEGVDFFFSFVDVCGLERICLMEDSFAVIVKRSMMGELYRERWPEVECALRSDKKLSVIKEMPFIILNNRWGHTERHIKDILRQYHFEPIVNFRSDVSELNWQMCFRGKGGYITTLSTGNRILSYGLPDMGVYPIDTPGISCGVYLHYDKRKRLNSMERCFVKFAGDFLQREYACLQK